MNIFNCKTNHIASPLGFAMDYATVSWTTESNLSQKQTKARVVVALDQTMTQIIYDSAETNLSCTGVKLPFKLSPRTAYYWTVQVWGDGGDTAISKVNYFETGKLGERLQGKWITPPWTKSPYIRKTFQTANVKKARLYIIGLGLYHLEVNGSKVGNDFFAPGCTQIDRLGQIYTYDLTQYLLNGNNVLGLMMGNGWYKATFGGSRAHRAQTPFIDKYLLKAELRLTLADGTEQIITTDESWRCTPSPIVEDSIYGGEVYDARLSISDWSKPNFDDSGWDYMASSNADGVGVLADRLSLPIVVKETIKPVELIHTPIGETVIDLGQNITGWLSFSVNEPAGTIIKLQHGEILQDGCFYNDNLRSAKAEFVYVSNGNKAIVSPYFTFFGFRYVKITGNTKPIDINDFMGCVVYSDLDETGFLTTSDANINRLYLNAKWSQKDNFLDVPTDCPQRDERMGWTGDAQMFCKTACYNMDTYAFYRKYLRDIWTEQKEFGGRVGHVAPSFIKDYDKFSVFWRGGSCAWGDAAVIIPWTIYEHYGDVAILEEFYPSMTGWINWIDSTVLNGDGLWEHGFKFGDWLALDGDPNQEDNLYGGTDTTFVASAYLKYSAQLVAKTATVLGRPGDAIYYQNIVSRTKDAIQKAYFNQDGTLRIRTQTAHVLALAFDLAEEEQRPTVAKTLINLLEDNDLHLNTGFVGTPFLCKSLSDAGYSQTAYTLLFQNDFPSWLYEVKMGATTIWERWNSVLPNGKISDTGMNSLNHYTYGCIVQWMYEHICGLNQTSPGFKSFKIRPEFDSRFSHVSMKYNSPMGTIETGWKQTDSGYQVTVSVPFDTTAIVELPNKQLIELSPGIHTIKV
ncbi:MAG: family 78 glycoside hydrolase catalytic domain [Clostridia bacterium]|nr:family 78 glycoside hydrolase catalytic domain [Clostridia bacterium]